METPHKSVGIIVPTLGSRPEWLYQSLNSILAQRGCRVEIVVVCPLDSGLSLGDLESQVSIIETDQPGLSKAINIGHRALSVKRLDYVTWLADDDLLTADSLRRSISALDRHEGAIFAFGRTTYITKDSSKIYTQISGKWALWYALVGQNYVAQPGSLFRMSAIDWHPFVDESLRNSMDLDLFLRAWSRQSERAVFVNASQSYYRLHEEAITAQKGLRDESQMVRSRYAHPSTKFSVGGSLIWRLVERVWVKLQWIRVVPGSTPHRWPEVTWWE